MIINYKENSVKLEKLYYCVCGFYKEKICFVLWEDLMAFMSKVVGFDYTIKTIGTDKIPLDAVVYYPHEPSVENNYSNYCFKKIEEIMITEEAESVFTRFERKTY